MGQIYKEGDERVTFAEAENTYIWKDVKYN